MPKRGNHPESPGGDSADNLENEGFRESAKFENNEFELKMLCANQDSGVRTPPDSYRMSSAGGRSSPQNV